MIEIVTILVILAGLSAFAMLAAWFVRVGTSRLWLLGGGRDAFWERTLPWPRGVQEDDEIAWHVPRPVRDPEGAAVAAAARGSVVPAPPTHPQRRSASR